jgi:hypothetical protein
MLRTELVTSYLLAGFAEALIPARALSQALHAVGSVPVIGYVLLLLVGPAIAVATFVCSMGNVPVARFLKGAGVPLGANIAYVYGDLLILPLARIYRRSFPPKLAAAFLALFTAGACLAGAAMEALIHALPWDLERRPQVSFTTIADAIALAVIVVLAVIYARGEHHPGSWPSG